ncbi:signal recognition particle-docking protein FtsY [Salinarchaeum laminariae]|uniref:signal recognition particle-docking protein FtsY n=1 Tax=Salinarchaeum laminariae TaxID=869888 RepID=UPI0020BD4EAA|nr:signal recognition particle-docking protein FtsY [Salinarchaeum laminariae]
MFDGLKETLGSFRDDAEAAAEENVEEEDVEDDAADEQDAGNEQAADGEQPAEDEAAEQAVADPEASGADVENGADAQTDATPDAETTHGGESADAADDGDGGDDPADDTDDDPDTGFVRKAKSLTRGKFVIEEDDLEGPLQDLEMSLLASDVEMDVANALLDNIREELIGETRTVTTSTGAVVEEALQSALMDVISVGQFDFEERLQTADKPVTIIFTGVNGVGKTTSIAKLSEYLADRGLTSVMANGDTFRAGANQQIREHADVLDRKLIAHEQGGDPAAVIYDAVEYADANDVDVVLGDTAGRLHTSDGLMDQLAKIERVVDPDMTIFVDEAVAGQDAVNRAREFDDAAAIDGTILTKADADSGGGAAISIAHVTGKPILFLGTGQGYDDIERFDPEWVAEELLGE